MVAAAGRWLGSLGEKVTSARFPVRIKVPNRDELIAAGLSTLALGLVLGLAIGPGFGGTGSILPAFAGPLAPILPGISGDEGVELPTLQAPAGSSGAPQTVAAAPPSVATDPGPTIVYVDGPAPADPPVTQAGNEPGPSTNPGGGGGGGGEEEGLPLEATVVGVSVTGRSYAVADDSGNLFTIFSNGVPAVGDRVATEIFPLSNGTFGQLGDRTSKGRQPRTTMRGVVSYVDGEVGILVLSSRGTSIPVSFEPVPVEGEDPPQVGTSLTAEVEVVESSAALRSSADDEVEAARPLLRMISAEATFYEDTAVEFNGPVRALDREGRTIEIAADGEGLLDGTVRLGLPRGFDFGLVVVERAYSVTARRDPQGVLQVTGLSPASSRKGADDRSSAFGEHA